MSDEGAVDPGLRLFFEVHSELPREGPGNRASTARALAAAGPLPDRAKILDIGCGPGMQTRDLAELVPDALITAVDAHQPFLDVLANTMKRAGLDDRVTVQCEDMRALPFPDASYDLIWCEGAAYIMGVENALRAWRRLLTPGGRLAFTDAVWLTDSPPDELRDWWSDGYPDMGDVAECLRRVERNGFRILDHFTLPESAWWDDYYRPMEDRLIMLRERFSGEDGGDVDALALLDECQREIDYFRRWSGLYGYQFVIVQVDGESA